MDRAPETRPASPASRLEYLLFGLVTYVAFLATFLAVIAFLSGLPLHDGLGLPLHAAASSSEAGKAALLDVLLLMPFVVQHTVMARPAFKRAWLRLVPEPMERSVFVLATCLALLPMLLFWWPIAGFAWNVTGSAAIALWTLGGVGWGIVLLSSFLIDHFELFGVRQSLAGFRGQPFRSAIFRERGLYRIVRHPLMLGFVIAFWACPVMSWDRLLFAVAETGYILLIGLVLEERDLMAAHGEVYADYRRRVPRLVPWRRRG